jgi:hypothetical protein
MEGLSSLPGVGIVIPATYCRSYTPFLDGLVMDTKCSNTWVGARKSYKKTITSAKTSDPVVCIALAFRLVVQRRRRMS